MSIKDFQYYRTPIYPYTFDNPLIKTWVESRCNGRTLNAFCGKNILNINEFRVDLDENMPADFHGDLYDYLKNHCSEKFDTVIFDPPFSFSQSKQKYDGRFANQQNKIINLIYQILNIKGRFISLGYRSSYLATKRQFKIESLAIFSPGGCSADVIGCVEIQNGQTNLY